MNTFDKFFPPNKRKQQAFNELSKLMRSHTVTTTGSGLFAFRHDRDQDGTNAIANLAGSYLQGKADKASANAKLKLVEAESKAAILMSKETSTADWERIMAESTKNSWKDEFITIVVMIPVIL